MQRVLDLWNMQPRSRQIIALLCLVAAVVSVGTLMRMASQPSMALLYAGLEESAAGEVIDRLQAQGIEYQVRADAILVPMEERDTLRMTLASLGLPKSTSQGYEILDNLSGFGTTSQMFDAAYWRAKEGELARTLQASPHVSMARVHISRAPISAFRRDQNAKASVTVATPSGTLSPRQAEAMRFLVASAVQGLSPEDVSVIDDRGGLILDADEHFGVGTHTARAQEIRARVERLLEAHVGPGNAVVEVDVDIVTESESISERVIDPDSRVIISSDTEEKENSSIDTDAGVTVASNLPDGDITGLGERNSATSENRQRLNFEISEKRREIVRQPGAIRRLTVAVLVNESPTGRDLRTPAELDSLRELVSAAVGFNAARGDLITVKTLAFEPISQASSLVPASEKLDGFKYPLTTLQTFILLGTGLILAWFVLRPLLFSRYDPSVRELTSDALNEETPELIAPEGTEAHDAPQAALSAATEQAALPRGKNADADDLEGTNLEKLKHLIENKRNASLQVLLGWAE